MKRKLSKLGRSTVSVLLCLVMLLTTFCFFDIGSVISEALVSKSDHALTEAGNDSSTFAKYNILMPELVYIKAGGKDSEYFLNATSSGTVSEPTSETGVFSFSCATARSVTISITVLDANLNASSANRVTNVAFTDGSYMSSDKSLSASSSTVTKTIKSISMANFEENKQYIIRWNIVYTTASGSYTTYAYTGIKFPLLAQAGMTTRQYYYGTYGGINGNPAESTTYSFITGVDAVKGGNVGSKWVSTGSTLTAPLINFNASLYPRGLDMPIDNNYFNPDGSGVLLAFAKDKTNGTYLGEGSRIYNTPWDSSQSYKPMDLITDDMVSKGYFGGNPGTDGDSYGYAAADIMIDTSRYTNFKQVPNLRAGFVEFDSDGGANQNYLNSIRNVSYTSSDAAKYFRKNKSINNDAGSQNTAPTIYCPDVDRGNEKNDRSWVRGLYKLDGNITTAKNNLKKTTSGGTELQIASFSNNVYSTYIRFEYSLRFNPPIGFDEYCSGISTVRLNATLTDKSTARKYYSRFLNSGVNTSASNWSTIEGYVKSYVKTLCVPTAAAGSYTNPTSAISTAQTNLKTVMKTTTPLSAPLYFYVPETIYLAPNIDSSRKSSSANFQWFIQNNVNTTTAGAATTKTGYDTEGYVYFSYANADTTQNVSLTATTLNTSGSVISGGSIKSLTFSDDGVYKKATITQESTSPSLTAATTGYYIRWTVKYTDAVDGYEKQAVAYTYVYKPYIQPTGVAFESRNEAGKNHDGSDIVWVSGVHGNDTLGERFPNSVNGGNRSLVTFSSTAQSDKLLGEAGIKWYAQFPTWFGASAKDNTPSEWLNTSASTYLPKKTFNYLKYYEGHGGFWGGSNPNSNHSWMTAPQTSLYVDTSRYSNLKDIPNLSAGLFVTDIEKTKSADKGAWYVADATDTKETVSQTENQRDKNNFGSARTLYYNYKKIIANQGEFDSQGDYHKEGVKYNGPINIDLMKGAGDQKVYQVKATYTNSQSTDKITNAGVMPIKVYQNDKGDLRKAVMRAQNNFPNLGITYNGSSFSSYFYSGTEFTTFCTNYERAYKELVKLDGRFYSSKTIAAIANELNLAIDNLIAGKSLKTNCTAREYNLGLEKLDNGQYKIVEISGGQQYEITYDARDNVYFTPDTYEGYTYVGKCALTNESIAPSDYYGKTLASLPAFFSASNLYSNSMSYSGSTVTIGTTTVKTTTVPRFDGDTTAYEWVAAVNDTSLTMVNFYFIDQNKIYFDPNDGSSKVNNLFVTDYSTNGSYHLITSKEVNGVTVSFDRSTSEITLNGTATTNSEFTLLTSMLPENFSAGNYRLDFRYTGGSVTGEGTSFSTSPQYPKNSYIALALDLADANGTQLQGSNRNWMETYGSSADSARTMTVTDTQASLAKNLIYQVKFCVPSGTSITELNFNNYKFKLEFYKADARNATYSPNPIVQFYGHSIGTMPVPVRDNYRFLGWFTAPDGGDRVTASSLMGSTDRTVYAHWAVTDKVLLLDNDFNFDDFVRKASNNNAFDTFMNSYKACKLPGMKNPLSYQENDYFSYSIAKDTEGDTALNVKYDRKHIVDAGVDEVFDTFKSDTYTASVEGEYTLTYEYRINDYYSYIKDTNGKSEYDSIVLGFSTNDGYWYNGGQGVSYTENRKTTDGYEFVESKRTFTAGTQYFFNMIFYFAYYNNYNELRADMDIKNIVLKDPNGNIVLSSNGMNTVNGTSSFDSDARAITLNPTGTDCYTNTYNSLSGYRSTLEAGEKYTLLMDYQAMSPMRIIPSIFFYPNETSTTCASSNCISADISVTEGSGTIAMQFTVPSDNYYQISFRENSVDGSTVPGALTLGNISLQRTEIFSDGAYVADSSTYLGWVSKVTGSASATAVYVNDLNSRNEKIDSHYQNIDYGAQYDELYVPTREGFTFLGWYSADGTQYTDANGKAIDNYVCTTDGLKLYSRWTASPYTITYVKGNGDAVDPETVNYTMTSAITIENAPKYEDHVFIGWKVTLTDKESNWTSNTLYNAEEKIGTGKFGNVTIAAQWVNVKDAEVWNKKFEDYDRKNSIDITIGVDEYGNEKIEKRTVYDDASFAKYKKAVEDYRKIKNSLVIDVNSSDYTANLEVLNNAAKALANTSLSEKKVVTDYLNNFRIDDTTTGHKLSEMNLNHYKLEILDKAKQALDGGNAIANGNYNITATDYSTGTSYQAKLNSFVFEMAKAFISTSDKVKTAKPGFNVYESVDSVSKSEDASLKALAGATASNYVHTKKGATYYCYVNTTNPVILVTIEDGIGGGRVCYPTTATALKNADGKEVTLSGSAKSGVETYSTDTITAKNFDTSYSKYTNVGIGGDINRYKQKQVIKLTPEFVGNSNGTVTYEFTAEDDALKANVANQAKLSSDTNYSSTARYSLIDPKKPDTVDNRKYTTNENTIKIVVDYHVAKEIKDKNGNPTGEFQKLDVTGDQVQIDKYLNQYHLFRQSGGASNWELPKTGDPEYTVNDGTYKQTDRGSFTFTFKLGSSVDLKSRMKDKNGNDIGPLPTLNTTDAKKIAELFNVNSNYDEAKKALFVGAKNWTKDSNGTRVQHEGSGLGYQVWGNNWSFNYYPKSESYTYVHLVDRWGNVVDKVFYVGKQDINEVSVSTASADGAYTILEDGGSGIDTLSLNAGTLEILTDENSTLENNVYRTTGNTVRIKTGEANKSYTLSMKDKATNASTATLKSDGNGIITLSVEDTAYKSGVYTFMLNGTEINLYDGVNKDKYIVNVYDGEAEEGEAAEMIVITTGEVGKTRFTDTDGNTITVAASETNEDGTKTWRMSKSRPAGEYEYRISVKVGHNWIEENSTGKLIFTEKQLDTGRIVKAEYDEESGLYKLTIEGRATKIQFITEDGMTRTYTRYSEAVKSRKSYDAEGNEVPDTGRLLDHEVWLVNARLYSGQNYTVAGKFEAGWNREGTATLTAH